jgi:hypothetical protein
MALRIFNLGTRWRQVVNFTQPALLPGKEAITVAAYEAEKTSEQSSRGSIILGTHRVQTGSRFHLATYLEVSWAPCIGKQRSGREADHSLPYSAKVKYA